MKDYCDQWMEEVRKNKELEDFLEKEMKARDRAELELGRLREIKHDPLLITVKADEVYDPKGNKWKDLYFKLK